MGEGSCQNLRENFGDSQGENSSVLPCKELNPTHNLYAYGIKSWESNNKSQWEYDFPA